MYFVTVKELGKKCRWLDEDESSVVDQDRERQINT